MNCKVRVTKDIADLYPHCKPEVGKTYFADYIAPYEDSAQTFKAICIVNVCGKRIILREGEFEIVGDSNEL